MRHQKARGGNIWAPPRLEQGMPAFYFIQTQVFHVFADETCHLYKSRGISAPEQPWFALGAGNFLWFDGVFRQAALAKEAVGRPVLNLNHDGRPHKIILNT
jgi:hypothetical protein